MNRLLRQFSTFAGVGFAATALHYSVLIGLVEIADAPAVVAALAGFTAGGLLSYSLNRRHTFHSSAPHLRAGWRFAVVAAIGFALTAASMSALVDYYHVPYLPAQAATTGLVMFWSFAAHRIYTFT